VIVIKMMQFWQRAIEFPVGRDWGEIPVCPCIFITYIGLNGKRVYNHIINQGRINHCAGCTMGD